MFAWVGGQIRNHFQLSIFSWRKSSAEKQYVCVYLLSIVSEKSLRTALRGASPLLEHWAPFEVLKYQNRTNSLKWKVGLYLHERWIDKWSTDPSIRTYFGKTWKLLTVVLPGFSRHYSTAQVLTFATLFSCLSKCPTIQVYYFFS